MPNIVLILQKVLDGIHQQNIVSGLRDKNIKHFNTWNSLANIMRWVETTVGIQRGKCHNLLGIKKQSVGAANSPLCFEK